jgi:hypothetical protein
VEEGFAYVRGMIVISVAIESEFLVDHELVVRVDAVIKLHTTSHISITGRKEGAVASSATYAVESMSPRSFVYRARANRVVADGFA